MQIQHFLDNLWRWKCDLQEVEYKQKAIPSYEELRKSEWSNEFENYMRNRLVMGAIRYGLMHEPNKPQYNRVESMIKRLNQYEETGNKEILVDIANLCVLEFEECHHPNAHFYAQDGGHHTEIKK